MSNEHPRPVMEQPSETVRYKVPEPVCYGDFKRRPDGNIQHTLEVFEPRVPWEELAMVEIEGRDGKRLVLLKRTYGPKQLWFHFGKLRDRLAGSNSFMEPMTSGFGVTRPTAFEFFSACYPESMADWLYAKQQRPARELYRIGRALVGVARDSHRAGVVGVCLGPDMVLVVHRRQVEPRILRLDGATELTGSAAARALALRADVCGVARDLASVLAGRMVTPGREKYALENLGYPSPLVAAIEKATDPDDRGGYTDAATFLKHLPSLSHFDRLWPGQPLITMPGWKPALGGPSSL